MFKVKDYLEMMGNNFSDDFMSIDPYKKIGVRGRALLARYLDSPKLKFTGNVEEFNKRIDTLPVAVVKPLLLQYYEKNYKEDVINKVNLAIEEITEDSIISGAKGMLDGGNFSFQVKLPNSKKSINFVPVSEGLLDGQDVNTRYDLVTICLEKFEGSVLTKEGKENTVKDMDYLDFDFIYLFNDRLNSRISSLDWNSLLKN